MTTAALIVAAGRGSRAGVATGAPKQYASLAGEAMLTHTLRAFTNHPAVDLIRVVIHPDDRALYDQATAAVRDRLAGGPVLGGPTRQDLVRLGLEALAADAPANVLIHDAARPFVAPDVISRVVDTLATRAGAIAASPVADTLKRAGLDGTVAGTVDRAGLWRAETPQGFRFKPILAAHRRAAGEGRSDFTDDAALAEWAGLDVALVMGSAANVKVTSAEDLALAARLMGAREATFEPRTGSGFDVHRFGPGDHVWLGGVRIPHEHGLIGHSDADAPLHALTDALLGAICEGDIGDHFPPSDPRWKGAPSRLFVIDAARRVAARGARIVNVDLTILAEAPRIAPHRDAIRAAIAEMLGIDAGRVAVKATTTEGLGFTGRGEGLAAMATATILLPN